MYVDSASVRSNGKTYSRHLLRSSFRQGGKVRHKTIANLSDCSDEEIAALKLALKHKGNLGALGCADDVNAMLGKRFGAVWTLWSLAERVGINEAVGNSRDGKLALLQVLARAISQGSRLSAVRLAKKHAACEVLGIDKLDEDDLYDNLAWLAEHQEDIEKKLFALRFPNTVPTLFLYDVTSSYLEGDCNALATWGYNRDRKSGKMQIVVGLLADPDGLPVAVRVFEGNTNDTKTVAEQVRVLAHSFGVTEVTLVGDRGMLKGPQIDALPEDFSYITAISKPQIRKMLGDGVLQVELFDKDVCEVEQDGVRYILRRNPVRAEQMAAARQDKLASLEELAKERTTYLSEHPRATTDKTVQSVTTRIKKLKADKWLRAVATDRTISIQQDDAALQDAALLDGCYVIKSDVADTTATAQALHDRYCDLENVERSFRTMKTTHLELRPVYVRKEASTRGHVFVVMLALLLQRQCEQCWRGLDLTVEEAIDQLGAITLQELQIGGRPPVQRIPTPDEFGRELLAAAAVELPAAFPKRSVKVHTKKSLTSQRKAS